jgi:hypothetical protein
MVTECALSAHAYRHDCYHDAAWIAQHKAPTLQVIHDLYHNNNSVIQKPTGGLALHCIEQHAATSTLLHLDMHVLMLALQFRIVQ